MALTREDKQEIAEMIACAGLAMALTPGAFDSDVILDTVKEPDEHRFVRITGVRIRTIVDPDSSEGGVSHVARVSGEWTAGFHHLSGLRSFFFPPNAQEYLEELKRVQDHHLLEDLIVWFREYPDAHMITKVVIAA